MKINPWTAGLAAAGVISFAGAVQAEEAKNQVLTAVSGTTLSGYVSTTARWDFSSKNAVTQYAYGAGKSDRFNLDVVDLTFAKNLPEGDWASGYKAELWIGPDAAVIGNNISGFGSNDLAIKQAYVELRAPIGNGLDLKMGVFDTVVGYESANAGDNPNYTRSFGYTIEPTEHVGILASYRFCDNFSASVGIANSYTAVLNSGAVGSGGAAGGATAQSQKTYMASATLTAPESFGFLKGGTLTVGVVDGRTFAAAASTAPDSTLVYVGVTIPTPVENLSLGAAWDHLNREGTSAAPIRDTDAAAIYASYKASDKLKLNARADWINNMAAVAVGAPGAVEDLAMTLTADYSLWENVITRLEYRWDHALSGHLKGTALVGPFAGGRVNTSIIALNVIYKF
ncbi:MAG: outer membrane beta-barrel protein [Verrucomicrobia bacterium]|nr:outer membrane beta-barrel protein [Verrucomicrobiota bacterium]